MSVYVDKEKNKFGRMILCHMVADTLEELHAMADKIGLRRDWFQVSRGGMPHYDVSLSRRKRAIALGAVEIDRRRLVEIMRRYRRERKEEL